MRNKIFYLLYLFTQTFTSEVVPIHLAKLNTSLTCVLLSKVSKSLEN